MSLSPLAAEAISGVRCDDMAVTSIWRVNGWLGKVVIYIENPDKTENPAYYEAPEQTVKQLQNLSDVIDYAGNSDKTTGPDSSQTMQQFVSGVNCHPATARDEMLAVKKRFGKESGTVSQAERKTNHSQKATGPGKD